MGAAVAASVATGTVKKLITCNYVTAASFGKLNTFQIAIRF